MDKLLWECHDLPNPKFTQPKTAPKRLILRPKRRSTAIPQKFDRHQDTLGNAVRKVGESTRKYSPFLNQHHAPQVSPVLSTSQTVRLSPSQRPWETQLPG